MTALLILCRHGNTFEKGETPLIVGAREDLPLTDEGVQQAHRVAAALKEGGVTPTVIRCGPLKRTVAFAETVSSDLGGAVTPTIEPKLLELDYGAWGGLSQEQIVERFGAAEIQAWQESSVRPQAVTFSPSQEQLEHEVSELLADAQRSTGVALFVTSNGRLREFGRIVAPHSTTHHKVKTGHACVLKPSGTSWTVLGWDLSTEQLRSVLKSHS